MSPRNSFAAQPAPRLVRIVPHLLAAAFAALFLSVIIGWLCFIFGCAQLGPEQSKPAGWSSMTRAEAGTFAAVWWASLVPDRRTYGTVTPTGSMLPSFDSRSILLLEKLDTAPLPGDILSVNEGPGREHVGHRVRAVKDGYVLLDGDNNKYPDGWFPVERIAWRVAGILYTNGR